jgi:hypothetical protein
MSQKSGQSSSESDGRHIIKARDGTKYYSDGYEPPYQQLINKIVSVKWADGNIYSGKFSGLTRGSTPVKHYKFMYNDGDEKWYQLHKTVKGDIIAIDTHGGVKRFFFGPKSVEQNPELTSHPTTTSGQNTQPQSKSVYNFVYQQQPQGSDKILPEYAREETRVDESSGSRGGTRKRKTKRKSRKSKRRRKKKKKTRKKRKSRKRRR